MKRIGFIGTGHIAAPMVRFLARKGHQIVVSERNAQTAQRLQAEVGVTVAPNQAVVDQNDIVFLCVRPPVAEDAIAPLTFRADQQIVSVMSGISLAQLGRLCAPATHISMTIPLGYLAQGGCPLAACPDGQVLAPLFEPENPVISVTDEAAFNKHFAICAFVPGVLDLMATASRWLGEATGDPDQAARYTRALLSGFLNSMPEGGAEVITQERDALATEGTLSLQMTQALQDGGAHAALTGVLTAIGDRLGSKS